MLPIFSLLYSLLVVQPFKSLGISSAINKSLRFVWYFGQWQSKSNGSFSLTATMNFIKLSDIYRLRGILFDLMLFTCLSNPSIRVCWDTSSNLPMARKTKPSKYILIAIGLVSSLFLVLLHKW